MQELPQGDIEERFALCLKNEDYQQCKEIYSTMDLVKKAFHIHVLLRLACKVNSDEVAPLFDAANKEGIPCTEEIYFILLEFFARSNDITTCEKLLELAKAGNITMPNHNYEVIQEIFATMGNGLHAVRWWNLMEKNGVECTGRAYSTMLSAHAKERDFNSMMKLYNEAKQNNIQVPEMYDLILGVCSEKGKLDTMKKYGPLMF